MSNPSKSYKAAWYQANKPRLKLARIEYRKKNKKRLDDSLYRYRAAHPEMVKKNQERWRKKNIAYYAAKCAERYAKKTASTPQWRNSFFIEEIYDLARRRTKMLGYKWHVDHIVPLRNKIVCGLHVENNLRVIPAIQNYVKGNRTWPDMP
jgi:hypothetical protein